MTELNLTAKGKEQEMVLAYLKDNASDALAAKINNGTPFVKDGKQLINRKSLDGFMSFASEEARKQAENNARCACVLDATVYGWAVHYFEEDGIAGTLYNADGTEYKPQKPTIVAKSATPPVQARKPQQPSLFDLMTQGKQNGQSDEDETDTPDGNNERTDGEEIRETIAELAAEETRQVGEQEIEPIKTTTSDGLPFYRRYTELQNKYPGRIIALRLGDFYEVFGDDAVTVAGELDLTLTSRDCGVKRVPLIGFPYHAADNYFGKLIAQGYKLAVVETLGAPRLLEQQEVLTDAIDPETGQVLTEAEMRLFDGDVREPKEIPGNEVKAIPAVSDSFDAEALRRFERVLGNNYVLR